MKYSVSNYSYSKMIQAGTITPFECIAKTRELGFDAIEFVDFIGFSDLPETEWISYAQKLKSEADRVGLEISSFTIGADFLNKGPEELDRVKKMIDIGAVLGVKRMRHDATVGRPWNDHYVSFETVLPQLADACREIAAYAETKGIRTMIENHGYFCQDSERVEKLHRAVNHPNFSLLCDMGNFMCADEDPAAAFARVVPFAAYIHAKDFILKGFDSCDPGEGSFRTRAGNFLRGTIVGHGHVPVKQCLFLAKKAGYDDYVSIEFEGMEDAETALRIGLANLKKYWAEV